MNQLPENITKTAGEFLVNLRGAFGTSLRSVILYGPAARGEKTGKGSPINFMVVLNDNTPSELARCAQYLKKWRKQSIATPLFLEAGYIGNSLDTFPLEFMDMQSAYTVMQGEDVLKDLSFNAADVRSQCERELKGKLLHLRAEYLASRGNAKELVSLINRSLGTFRLVFTGALYLKGLEIPAATADILEAVTGAYELDVSLFKQLTAVARGDIKVTDTEADRLFDLYVEELDRLSGSIDTLPEKVENGEQAAHSEPPHPD